MHYECASYYALSVCEFYALHVSVCEFLCIISVLIAVVV